MIHISGGMAWQKVLRFSLCVRIICCIPGKANKTVHSIFKSSVPGKWSVYEYFRGRARPCGPELVEVHVFTFDGIHSLLKDIMTVGPGICFNSSSSALRDFYFICRICSSGF